VDLIIHLSIKPTIINNIINVVSIYEPRLNTRAKGIYCLKYLFLYVVEALIFLIYNIKSIIFKIYPKIYKTIFILKVIVLFKSELLNISH